MISVFLKPLNPKLLRRAHLPLFTIHRLDNIVIRSMTTQSTHHRMFQLKLDPLTGNSEWVVIDDHQSPTQPLLATTSYLDMLNDSCRNNAYRQAIDKAITGPCHVLDIGAGTGLLSMMAARAMHLGDANSSSSSKGMVTACESYLPMVKLMRRVLRANSMEKNIRVINKRSDDLEVGVDLPSRAEVLVSEILDSELLGEGLIPTLQHAHDKLLVENPLTVPHRATVFGQLVESKYLWKLHDLFNQESETSDGIQLVPKGMRCVKRQQYPMHCDAIAEEIKLLSEPFKIFDFDFWKRPESCRHAELRIKAINHGTVHAVISWWLLQLDSRGTIFYSTAPKWVNIPTNEKQLESCFPDAGYWCDHWKQCVCFIPEGGFTVCKNDEVHLHATHSDTSISYDVKASPQKMQIEQRDLYTEDCQIFLSPERVGIYGDSNWRCSVLKAIKNALQQKDSPFCVVADDSIFLTVAIASFSKTSRVVPLFPGLREKGMKYLHAVSAANDFSMDRIEISTKRDMELKVRDPHQRKIDILVGEPFFNGGDSMLPWANLRFWKERTLLDPILSDDVLIMPCKGILRARAMSLPDLWKSRQCLGDIEGFDHSVVNSTLGACGDLPAGEESPCLAFPIWQCGEVKMLSDTITVMEFNLMELLSSCSGNAQIEFTDSGICHGFALWIDWVMDAENLIVLSTGPDRRHWKQGVKLFEKPLMVGSCGSSVGCPSINVKTSFDPSSGELIIKHTF